jgi:hypothetical protein
MDRCDSSSFHVSSKVTVGTIDENALRSEFANAKGILLISNELLM